MAVKLVERRAMRLVKSWALLEIFTQPQKLLLQLPTDYKTVISIQFGIQENQREAFQLPVSWVPMNMVISYQISDRPVVDGITQSLRHTDLDGLMDSCFKN